MTVGIIFIYKQLVIKHTLPNLEEIEEQNILDEHDHDHEKFNKQVEHMYKNKVTPGENDIPIFSRINSADREDAN